MINLASVPIYFNLILLIWVIILTLLWLRLSRNLQNSKLAANTKDSNRFEEVEESLESIINEIKRIELLETRHLQRVGFMRFNPFNETGGNQSFSVALLDDEGNGIVLSSLHSRETTRVYGKPVKAWGESGFEFSKEEVKAIELAKTKN